jgi:hypothetical protein
MEEIEKEFTDSWQRAIQQYLRSIGGVENASPAIREMLDDVMNQEGGWIGDGEASEERGPH